MLIILSSWSLALGADSGRGIPPSPSDRTVHNSLNAPINRTTSGLTVTEYKNGTITRTLDGIATSFYPDCTTETHLPDEVVHSKITAETPLCTDTIRFCVEASDPCRFEQEESNGVLAPIVVFVVFALIAVAVYFCLKARCSKKYFENRSRGANGLRSSQLMRSDKPGGHETVKSRTPPTSFATYNSTLDKRTKSSKTITASLTSHQTTRTKKTSSSSLMSASTVASVFQSNPEKAAKIGQPENGVSAEVEIPDRKPVRAIRRLKTDGKKAPKREEELLAGAEISPKKHVKAKNLMGKEGNKPKLPSDSQPSMDSQANVTSMTSAPMLESKKLPPTPTINKLEKPVKKKRKASSSSGCDMLTTVNSFSSVASKSDGENSAVTAPKQFKSRRDMNLDLSELETAKTKEQSRRDMFLALSKIEMAQRQAVVGKKLERKDTGKIEEELVQKAGKKKLSAPKLSLPVSLADQSLNKEKPVEGGKPKKMTKKRERPDEQKKKWWHKLRDSIRKKEQSDDGSDPETDDETLLSEFSPSGRLRTPQQLEFRRMVVQKARKSKEEEEITRPDNIKFRPADISDAEDEDEPLDDRLSIVVEDVEGERLAEVENVATYFTDAIRKMGQR